MDAVAALLLVIGLAFIFDMLSGMLSAPVIIATIIASRAVSPRRALVLSLISQFIGPFLFGVAVASTTSVDTVDVQQLTLPVLWAGLIGAIMWTLVSWWLHVPSSTSHAQIGALFGATLIALGPGALHVEGLLKIIIGLIFVAPLGLFGGFAMVRVCYWCARNSTPGVNRRFNQGQLLTAFFLGLAIGSNAAQRTVGTIVLGLLLTGAISKFEVPPWAIAISATGLCAGTLLGGRRLLRTIGSGFFRIRPIHGFSAQLASAIIILGSSLIGAPVSTTNVASLAVVGAGAAERLSIVRWSFVRHVVTAWILATPVSAGLGAVIYVLWNSVVTYKPA